MVTKDVYKKIEYYLYNYNNIDNLISETELNIIDNANSSGTTWLKGINDFNNTIENQAIKLATNKKIYNLKRWKSFLTEAIKIFEKSYRLEYEFMILKYFNKKTYLEINKILKIDIDAQKKLNINVIGLIAYLADKANLIYLER